jgi:hypothetical protein
VSEFLANSEPGRQLNPQPKPGVRQCVKNSDNFQVILQFTGLIQINTSPKQLYYCDLLKSG